MARQMPRLVRHSPFGFQSLLIRVIVPVLTIVSILIGSALLSAQDATVVWTSASIGPAYAQTQSPTCSALVMFSCPIFSLTAAGGSSAQDDTYGFTYRTLLGDGYVIGRSTEIRGVSTSLAGLSIRASLTRGAAQLSFLRTPAGSLVVRRRSQANGTVTDTPVAAVGGASWLRIERRGTAVTLAQSADGSQWSSVPGGTIELPQSALIGLAVTSQRPDALTTATFSNLQLVSSSAPLQGWTRVDLDGAGIVSQAQYNQGVWTLSQSQSGTSSGEPVTFVYQRVTGDAEISERVMLTSTGAFTGLMIRATLQSDSPYVWLRTNSVGQRSMRRRLVTGQTPATTALSAGVVPGWLKVARQGAQLNLYHSSNGMSWTLLNTFAIDLPSSFYLGLALARGSAASAVAAIDGVQLQAATANQLPTILLTAPTNGQTVFEGDVLTLAATAADADDRVEAVEFFIDGVRVGVDTAAPFVASWIAAGVGTHQVTALARDSDGAIARTAPVYVSVLARSSYGGTDGTTSGGTTTGGTTTGGTTTGGTTTGGTTGGGGTTTGGGTTGTWRLAFTPSADHDRTVDRYTVAIFALNGLAMVGYRDLGRPAVVSGECSVDITPAVIGLPVGQYMAVVRAVDDSTFAQSVGAVVNFLR